MFRPFLRLYPVFLVAALIAALYGFSTVSSGAGDFAKILFVVLLALAALSFLGGWLQDSRETARREAAWRQ
ncbi:MAG TPA: DUF1328 domain-containing protein [Gemmataceae bacterium]|jgi:uncharacterized membrane protein YtjA (UPF0391 family)|nr:DUF1328 domain-containing protein [Gemmataceae bacterium]